MGGSARWCGEQPGNRWGGGQWGAPDLTGHGWVLPSPWQAHAAPRPRKRAPSTTACLCATASSWRRCWETRGWAPTG